MAALQELLDLWGLQEGHQEKKADTNDKINSQTLS